MNSPAPAEPNPGSSTQAGASASGLQPSVSNAQPPSIPDHELLRRIGGGSYGEVWLARNVMGTFRAVKIVHRNTFETERPYEREFAGIQKFEPVSRAHENLVDILQVGRDDARGCFYYVMELADDGSRRPEVRDQKSDSRSAESDLRPLSSDFRSYEPRTLRSEIQRRSRQPYDECVGLGRALASALAYLHGQELVHRDVKPSNIIFVGGVPKLADIGLVADVGEARSYVGTEGFIAPEGPGSPQADLFSLGKVLYEASTGKDRQDFPEPLTLLGEQPDKDRLLELNAIIHKACQPDPRARYQSAGEMLAELELLQRGQSVKGRRVIEQRRTLAKKFVLSLAAVAVLAVGAWALSTKLAWRSPDAARARLDAKKPPSPEVVRLCKLGEEAKEKGTKAAFTEAFEQFNRAIVLDPGYVPAHLGLASAYFMSMDWLLPSRQALPEVKRAATSALQLDPSSAVALQYLAAFKMSYEWDWAGAETDFKRAIQLGPKEAWPHAFYASLLLNLKRLPEARLEQERALALAPNDAGVLASMVTVLFAERRFVEALELALKGRREHTNIFAFPIWLAWIYERKGVYPQAIAELRAIRAIDNGPDLVAFEGYISAASGDKERARELLRELQGMSGRLVPHYFVALIHVGLGDSDAAIGCLQKAVAENSASLSAAGPFLPLAIDPHFDSLRSDPRFMALLREMGLEK